MWNPIEALLHSSIVRRVWYAPVWAIRNLRSGPRYLSVGERQLLSGMHGESIRRELESRSASPREYEQVQRRAYAHLWTSKSPLDPDEATPPDVLDRSLPAHVAFALSVVGDYDATRESSAAFADCLYRPVSDLPYPQLEIRRCCEFLIGIADDERASLSGDHSLLVNERDAIGFALFSLDYFLDLPAAEIPRQKLKNLAFARHRFVDRAKSSPTPSPGDAVALSASGLSERVAQVVGVCDNGEWMVVTSSGISMQVTSSDDRGAWKEVTVIAPLAAAWLSLTPPAGTPAWDAT